MANYFVIENSLFNCSVQSNSSKFSLESDAGGVKWARLNRIERSSALRIGVVVIVLFGGFVSQE